MGRLKDETGNSYGKWTVLRKDPNKNSSGEVCWICKCQCGNIKSVSGKILRRGKSKSCGLCNRKIIQIGDKFEDLTVIKKGDVQNSHQNWICKCSCGKIVSVRGSNLISGNTKSCGHNFSRTRLSLLGKKFGLLTVIQDMGNDSYGNSQWKCQCECGNIITVVGDSLRQNHTMSCGKCQFKSKGEFIITQLLKNNNIDFQREYTFPDLVTHYHNMKYRFDFAIFNNQQLKYLIEFDGPQHSKTSGTWFNEDKLKIIQNNDKKKEQYCIDNQIPLIRIPYSHLYKICLDDLILETTIYRKV